MRRPYIPKDLEALNSILDSVAAILITDKEGNFLHINDKFCELMEYEREELIGRPAKILKSGFHSKEFYDELWSTLLSGKRWRGKFCNKTKSEKMIWLDTIIEPVLNEKGEIEKFIGIRFDVTEEVINEGLLKTQERQLDAASKLATIGEIAGYIAHEINNPLTIMTFAISSLNSVLAQERPDREKVTRLQEKMNTVNNRMIKIAQALRNFSRNDHSKMEPTPLAEILGDVFLFTEDIIKSDSVELEVENNAPLGYIFDCHKNQISQVLINLIKNACDAIRPLEEKRLQIKIHCIGESLEIRVIDSGEKIKEEVAAHFFTPYYTTKSEGKGTGIGLTISQKIIEAHSGKIYFDRNSSETCFVVVLPKKQAQAKNLQLVKAA